VAAAWAATLLVCGAFAAHPDDRAPLLQSIDSLLNAARYDTARTLTIASIHEAEASGDSAAVGALAFRFGRLSVTLGDQAIARRELDRAIRLTEAARDTADLAPALIFRGFVHRDVGEIDEAMAKFQRALDLSRRAHIASAEAEATYNLAYRELRRGNLDAARPGYLRAMELWRSTGDPFQIAAGAGALGNLYTVLGEVDSARYWYHQSLRIARENRYPFHELWALNNLGDLGRRLGNYEVALDHYRAALSIGRRIGFDRGTALPAMNMALTSSYLGQRDLAFQSLDECLMVCRRAGFKDLEAANTITAGVLYLEAGYNGRASAFFRRILKREYVYDTIRRSEAAYGLSLALAQSDSIDQAIAVLEPYVSPRANVAHSLGQPYFEMGYANLLRRARRCSEAMTRLQTLQAGLSPGSRLGVVARLVESSCRRQLGDRVGAVNALTMALDSLEVARSQLGRADVREAYGLHMMSDVIDGCRVLLEYPDSLPPGERVCRFYDAVQRFKTRTLLERIRDPRGGYSVTLGSSVARPVTASGLQTDVLQPGELLLDLVVNRDESFMFAVTADSCRLVPLPGWQSDLAEKTMLYADLLSEPSGEVHDDYPLERLIATQRALGKTIIDPVEDLVADARRIIFAPDGFYASIPLGTLVAGEGGMLLESKEIMDVPSASVLAWTRAQRAGRREGASMLAVTDETPTGLAGARHETGQLRRRYANVEIVSAREGILDTLSQHARPSCILHVAAHARVNDASPWHSGFLLAAPESDSQAGDLSVGQQRAVPDDTFLRAWEIARSQLPYDMAVLAGCETAAGRATNGEGVLGLTSAFLSAGVPVVVSSRWPVEDWATAVLMEHFYDGLAAGKPVASALRDAQLEVRSHERTSHPFYWAGFAVVGDGSRVIPPVLADGRRDLWLKAVGGSLLAIGLAGWTLRRRRSAAPAGT
jgi:CHAT domain-containing protein/tetratricopeptide (TPR) repeat protein